MIVTYERRPHANLPPISQAHVSIRQQPQMHKLIVVAGDKASAVGAAATGRDTVSANERVLQLDVAGVPDAEGVIAAREDAFAVPGEADKLGRAAVPLAHAEHVAAGHVPGTHGLVETARAGA